MIFPLILFLIKLLKCIIIYFNYMNTIYGRVFLRFVLITCAVVIGILISSFFYGFVLSMGGNIQVVGIKKVAFDPMITIAYMVLYYLCTTFHTPTQRTRLAMIMFALILSFVINFIQGSVFFITVYYLLLKFKII